MPELPDLAVITEVLQRRIVGQTLAEIVEPRPLAMRNLMPEQTVVQVAQEQMLAGVTRQGKFLIWRLANQNLFVINLMLAGHLRFVEPGERILTRDYVRWLFSDGQEIRLNDQRGMAKVYLTDDTTLVPGFADMGPDALDEALDEDAFLQRLRSHRGEIKGILTRGACIAGIGNAYADEILFRAGIYPFRKRPSLSVQEQRALYHAMHDVIEEATTILRQRMGECIELKLRGFLAVHGKKGAPCPVCGNPISEINVQKRMTNFCRTCQPGSMFG